MFSARSFRLFLPALALACVSLAGAQQTVNNASLSGRVTDPQGAGIPGAAITARQTETNLSATTTSDRDGRFRFAYLAVGPYSVSVAKPGFAAATEAVTLTLGAAFELPLTLKLASTNQAVTVTGTPEVLESARSQIAETITPTEIDTLPTNGRNFIDLALLSPGVSPTNTASSQLFAETSAVPGQGISIASQRNFSNSYIVDGLSANDDAAGLTGTFYGLDTVKEFQVVTAGGQAEFGRALGGYVSMVTQSGTNTTHGDVYGFLRNQRLNAANPLTQTRLPLTQAQYGASLGGPIVKNHSFYFANFERRDLNQDGLITITPANVAAINQQLVRDGYGGSQIATGLYPNPVHNTNFFARADDQLRGGDQFSLRYSLYDVHSANSRGVGALSAASAAAALADRDQNLALSNIVTLSPTTVNETRAQFTFSQLSAPPNDPVGPAVSISGIANFGTLSASPTARLNRLFEVVDNLSHQAGAHSLRVGVDYLYNSLAITFPQSERGSYTFSSLANFQQGLYNNSGFTQSFGLTTVPQSNPNVGVYAQDEWQATSRLTLNAGVRYDLQFLQAVTTDTNNVAPRLGFAWTPFRSRRTVVRGSYGIFYDRVPLRALSNAIESNNNTTVIGPATFATVSLSPTQTGAPLFPNTLATVPAGVLLNLSTMDPHMQNAYSEQASLEIAQQVGRQGSLGVSYEHLRGVHLIVSVNENAPTCLASGNNNGCRPVAAYGNNKQYSPLANSQYDGLSVSWTQRPLRWGTARVSYTYSRAYDDVGEFFFSAPINNFNIWQDWGRSDDDQHNRVALDMTLHTQPAAGGSTGWQHLTRGFQLSGILQNYSASPFNIVTGANTVQGTTARPLDANGNFISRNAGNGLGFFNINARLSRTFAVGDTLHLEAIAEAFNVLNHRNNLYPNGTWGAGAYPAAPLASFGQPTSVGDPRTAQLALRLSF